MDTCSKLAHLCDVISTLHLRPITKPKTKENQCLKSVHLTKNTPKMKYNLMDITYQTLQIILFNQYFVGVNILLQSERRDIVLCLCHLNWLCVCVVLLFCAFKRFCLMTSEELF